MSNKTKFPGKPSKLVNKKRVSVLSFESFDRRASDQRESENSASPKHGYLQVNPESAYFLHFRNFRPRSRRNGGQRLFIRWVPPIFGRWTLETRLPSQIGCKIATIKIPRLELIAATQFFSSPFRNIYIRFVLHYTNQFFFFSP